jgi:serine/threonine-protein kinase 24/25/MST4
MSFGNGASTVRQFKRVSSGNRPSTSPDQTGTSPADSVFDSDSENKPPPEVPLHTEVPASKESILGRRCFAKSLDPAFQEAYAATGDRLKREALGKVAEAWSNLDELDPEGELLLLKGIMDRIQSDPKLASALLPQRVANAQLASLRLSPSKKTAMVSESEISARDLTPQSSPSKPTLVGSLRSPSKRDPPSSPSKLVLNPQNPHLKKMRSNQQLQTEREKAALSEKAALEEKMAGAIVEPGMEHTSMLADVLYGRWTDGLKARWPLA